MNAPSREIWVNLAEPEPSERELAAGAGIASIAPDIAAVLTRWLVPWLAPMATPVLRPPLPSTFNQSLFVLRPPALTLPPPSLPCTLRALGGLPSPCAGASSADSNGGCFCGLVGSLNNPPVIRTFVWQWQEFLRVGWCGLGWVRVVINKCQKREDMFYLIAAARWVTCDGFQCVASTPTNGRRSS